MSEVTGHVDVVLLGSGLGATAAARRLAGAGRRVAFVPGIGRSRSLDSDGGLVREATVIDAFGPGAPLGPELCRRRNFTAAGVEAPPVFGDVEEMPCRRVFRRLELEKWAQGRATSAGADYLDGFIEGRLVPMDADGLRLTEEHGDRVVEAATACLCEGSDPRIAMRLGLRPDYGPVEQLHFARTIIARPREDAALITGETRTRWGMPIRVMILPLGAETLVSVVARIENIMRSSRSSRDALEDLLASPLGERLGLGGPRIHTGMELVALRTDDRDLRISHGQVLLGLDASGLPDPRDIQRADATIESGVALASCLLDAGCAWEAAGRSLAGRLAGTDRAWHHSRSTGFLEEGGESGLLNVIGRIGRRVRRHGRAT